MAKEINSERSERGVQWRNIYPVSVRVCVNVLCMHDRRDIEVLKGGEEKKGIANEKRDKKHVLTDSSDH